MMQKRKDIVFSALPGGEGVLLNLETKRFYTLNPTGAFIYLRHEKGASRNEITRALTEDYEVEKEEAEKSVSDFFEELKKIGLI